MDHVKEFEQGQEAEERKIDVRFYWNVVKKRRWVIAATTIVVTALAVVMTMRKPKIYQATTSIIIDPSAPKALGNDAVPVVQLGSGNVFVNSEYYNTQLRILHSRSLARQVVIKFQLHKDPRIVPANIAAGKPEEELIELASNRVQGGLQVKPVTDSRVFQISFLDPDPEVGTDLSNYITDVYIEQNLNSKRDVTRLAKGWVAKLLDEARRDLDHAERELHKYKEENNILSVSMEDRQNITSNQIVAFSNSLTETQSKLIELRAKHTAISSVMGAEGSNPLPMQGAEWLGFAQLRTDVQLAERELTSLQKQYGPLFPLVVKKQSEVDSLRRNLQNEGRGILRALDAQVVALTKTASAYQAKVDELTQGGLALNKKEIQFRLLTRNVGNAEQVYANLMKRLNESDFQEQDMANNIRLLDEARVPTVPVSPNIRLASIMGFGLGLLFAFGLALFIEFLDRSVRTQEDVEQAIGVSFLGMVPSVENEIGRKDGLPDLFIAEHPTSSAAECCRVVRTNILFCSTDRPLKTMLVTSSNPSEGKTMTVVNLGIVMAQSGHRTLLVDTDMRRPRLHKALGVPGDMGVSRLILDDSKMDEAIKTTDVPNLFLLPCGPVPPNPAELLQTEKFIRLVEKLASKFDRVIFDSPPALAVTDAVILSSVMDGTVVVVRAGRTARDAVIRTRRSVQAVNGRVLGAVLNDVDLRNPHYAGYYYYYRHRYYGQPERAEKEA